MNDKVIKFLEEKKWSSPYTEVDLLDAIQLGRDLTIQEIHDKMLFIPVNGVVQGVITETMLKEMK